MQIIDTCIDRYIDGLNEGYMVESFTNEPQFVCHVLDCVSSMGIIPQVVRSDTQRI